MKKLVVGISNDGRTCQTCQCHHAFLSCGCGTSNYSPRSHHNYSANNYWFFSSAPPDIDIPTPHSFLCLYSFFHNSHFPCHSTSFILLDSSFLFSSHIWRIPIHNFYPFLLVVLPIHFLFFSYLPPLHIQKFLDILLVRETVKFYISECP